MAFGQQSGPPASARQVRELLELLQAAGHADFRDARGPMGFTQRQAGGRFTRDEAEALIDRLQDTASSEVPAPRPSTGAAGSSSGSPAGEGAMLRRAPGEQLAAELERRGWIVIPPP